jgi:hypothetical protein
MLYKTLPLFFYIDDFEQSKNKFLLLHNFKDNKVLGKVFKNMQSVIYC